MTDVTTAFDAIRAKQESYATLWNYYDGDQPLVYSTQRLREVFRAINSRFEQNWCAVVIDSVIERLELMGLSVPGDETLSSRLVELTTASELALESDDAHVAALVTGEAFIIAWPEDSSPQAFYNDPRLCHVEYDPEFPRKKLWAAKLWMGDDKKLHLTMYYPDRLEYYASDKPADAGTTAGALVMLPGTSEQPNPAKNETGEVPVFHLRRERRTIKSELKNVITLQDGVNKLFADMMVAAEFGAYKQRYVISQTDPGTLKNAPNEIWNIPAGDGAGQQTSVGEFSATDLKNYLGAMESLASSIGIITRTPKHYFFSQGDAPSGEALIAMEAPLNKKVGRYIERFKTVWEQVGAFLLKLDGKEVPPQSVKATFAKPETVQPETQAGIIKIETDSNLPLRTALRRSGWTEADLDQMDDDSAAEGEAQQSTLARALTAAQRKFDGGQA